MDHSEMGRRGAANRRSTVAGVGAHGVADRALPGDTRVGAGEGVALLVGLTVVSGWVAAMCVAGLVVLFGWLIWHPDLAAEEGRRG